MAVTPELTLGRGMLQFCKQPAGVARTDRSWMNIFRHILSSQSFSLTSEVESLQHFDSETKLKFMDREADISITRTGSFVTDSIDDENARMWIMGDDISYAVSGATEKVAHIQDPLGGRYYQLGATQANPMGDQAITNVRVYKLPSGELPPPNGDLGEIVGATLVAAMGNWEIDSAVGQLYIEEGGALDGDYNVAVNYDVMPSMRNAMATTGTAYYGSIKYIEDNAEGKNRIIYIPYAKVTPTGDLSEKGDEWKNLTFNVAVQKLDDFHEAIYIMDKDQEVLQDETLTVSVTTDKTAAAADGIEQVTATVTVTDSSGSPVVGSLVSATTDLGTLDTSGNMTTNASGVVTGITLVSATPGTAIITASCQGFSGNSPSISFA